MHPLLPTSSSRRNTKCRTCQIRMTPPLQEHCLLRSMDKSAPCKCVTPLSKESRKCTSRWKDHLSTYYNSPEYHSPCCSNQTIHHVHTKSSSPYRPRIVLCGKQNGPEVHDRSDRILFQQMTWQTHTRLLFHKPFLPTKLVKHCKLHFQC